jgi:hypothetical protein
MITADPTSDRHQREQRRNADDLEDGIAGTQPFDGGIGAGEDCESDQRDGDAAGDPIAGRCAGGREGDGGSPENHAAGGT